VLLMLTLLQCFALLLQTSISAPQQVSISARTKSII
jgi:hypothetical protein